MNLNEVVYVGNIPKPAGADELANFFKDAGRVVKVSFMRENRNDCRTKIGFVLFENEMQALKACSFDQTIFQWNRIIVMLVSDERHFLAGHTVMVRHISHETSEEDLYEAFGRYGMIESVQIPTYNYAYVGFKEKSAAIASQRLNEKMLGKHRITVQVMQCNTRVRLEDLDSFKTPRVYNELMDAKIKYDYQRNKEAGMSAAAASGINYYADYDDEDDEEDNRVYDPITNRFYDKPKQAQPSRSSRFGQDNDEDDEELLEPPSVRHASPQPMIDLVSPNPSPDPFDEPREAPEATGEIRRRDLEFCKVPVSGPPSMVDTAVRAVNIPRDARDEDVVKYFDQFGHIVSVEIENSQSCVFTKNYTIVFQQKAVAAQVLECFMRNCEFSGVTGTMFTMRIDEMLADDPQRCVLIDYISNTILFEDVVDAFRRIGQVIYVKKSARNTTPSVVYFRNRIVVSRAANVTKIDGDQVRVVPLSKKAFKEYADENWKLKKDAVPYSKKPLKNVRMMDIEMKEMQEKTNHMIIRTVFNPNYRNPEPNKLRNEGK